MNKDKSLSVANSSKTGRNCINCVGIQAGLGYSEFGYDEIGNSTGWAANSLNQYAQFAYAPDGNLLSDGVRTFAYDAANRLRAVSTNGVPLVENFYDAKSRRVRKVTREAAATFFYDGWNLVEECVAYANGRTTMLAAFTSPPSYDGSSGVSAPVQKF